MEIIVQIILLIAFLKYCLKAALTGKTLVIGGYALAGAIFAISTYTYIIELPTNVIEQVLRNKKTVADWAVLSTAEAIVGIFLSLSLLRDFLEPKAKKQKGLFWLRIIPGVLCCVSIIYFQLLFFKQRAGNDFLLTAIWFSMLVFVLTFTMAFLFKTFMKEKSVQLELKMILNLAILGISLVLNATIADYNIANATYELSWQAFFVFVLVVFAAFALGLIFHKTDIYFIISKKIWNK